MTDCVPLMAMGELVAVQHGRRVRLCVEVRCPHCGRREYCSWRACGDFGAPGFASVGCKHQETLVIPIANSLSARLTDWFMGAARWSSELYSRFVILPKRRQRQTRARALGRRATNGQNTL